MRSHGVQGVSGVRIGVVWMGAATLLSGACGDFQDGAGAQWYPTSSYPATDPEEPTTEPPANQDRYEAPGTNPFVLAAADPLATFAADVDTASYDIFRRDVGLYGQLPNKDSVRLEEFVNYFHYAYPTPSADDPTPFRITVDAAPSPFSATTLVRVGIQARFVPPEAKRPANVVFLVDVSGSMDDPKKLPLVKVTMRAALDALDPTDRVSIVTYSGNVSVRLASTPVSEKTAITAAIDGLDAGGSTAGGAGLMMAYEQAESHFIEGGINHIILCTDGDFNVGASSDEAMVKLITEKRATGITLTTLGFGAGNLNDAMMEKVADAGNGSYSVIATEDQAVSYAHSRLLATLVMVAKDMKIQVAFNPAQVRAYRLLGYEDRAIADSDFRVDAVDAGEVGSGHVVTALFEVVPTGNVIPTAENAPPVKEGAVDVAASELPTFGGEDLLVTRVRYKDVGATAEDAAHEVAVAATIDLLENELADVGVDFRWAAAVAGFAEILKQSPFAKPSAMGTILELIDDAKGTSADRIEFADLVETSAALLR